MGCFTNGLLYLNGKYSKAKLERFRTQSVIDVHSTDASERVITYFSHLVVIPPPLPPRGIPRGTARSMYTSYPTCATHSLDPRLEEIDF